MKGPDPKSNRSRRRSVRGFKSLETSSRKHKRAYRRLAWACSLEGKLNPPGTKNEVKCGTKGWLHTAGGSMRFH